MKLAIGLTLLLLPAVAAALEYRHGFSYLWPMKYAADFEHFDYANPDAPSGGGIRVPVLGTYDSFNNIIDAGRDAQGLSPLSSTNLLYDRLLAGAADEPMSQYGQLAEGVQVADDFSWVAFRLREGAYWHDGEPITVEDVLFTFDTYKKHGSAWIKTMYRDVQRIERIGPREVRYVMDPGALANPSITLSIGVMPVLPKHYWEQHDITKTTITPPLGSGPYRITDFAIGRYVVYERVDNYWGRDLPVMKGRFNFDAVKYDYFRDEQVMLEALRGNVIDVREESSPKNWATQYSFPAVDSGLFRKELVPLTRPAGLQWPLIWNQRVERFKDPRVREALWLLYDFPWINRVLNHSFFEQGTSLFYGSEMAQQGLPSKGEIELLAPWRKSLPSRLFTEEWSPPDQSTPAARRESIERAIELFREAGWILENGKMVSDETGEVFHINFVLVSHIHARNTLPYAAALHRIGIETSIRVPEVSNWQYRIRTGDFDAAQLLFFPYRVPGLALRNHFGSQSADLAFTVNWGHVKNPVLDFLAEKVIGAHTRNEFLAAVRAADRVLLWGFHLMPGASRPGAPLVYWDKFGQPDSPDLERLAWLDTWWWDPEKAARVEEGLARLEAAD